MKNLIFVLFFASLRVFAQDVSHTSTANRNAYRAPDGQTVFLPRLLGSTFHTAKDICEDAQKHKRNFAIISIKTHACDCASCGENFCMEHTRNVSDPANTFIISNFAAYHSRVMRHPGVEKFGKEKLDPEKLDLTPGAREVVRAWGPLIREATGAKEVEPGLLIIDTKNCKSVGFIPMEKISTDKDREKRAVMTNDLIRAELAKIKPQTEEIRKLTEFPTKGLDPALKLTRPEITLPDYIKLLDAQLAKEDPKGADHLKDSKK